jgi:diacylglycerol kinase family enzyme
MTDERVGLEELIRRVSAELTDRGKLIEAGWASLHMMWLKDATPAQLALTRDAFFAGAHHLFTSIMTILDPDAEPTDQDLQRMTLIHRELEEFLREFKRRHSLDH